MVMSSSAYRWTCVHESNLYNLMHDLFFLQHDFLVPDCSSPAAKVNQKSVEGVHDRCNIFWNNLVLFECFRKVKKYLASVQPSPYILGAIPQMPLQFSVISYMSLMSQWHVGSTCVTNSGISEITIFFYGIWGIILYTSHLHAPARAYLL
jgi:hypothetical protein